MINNEAKRHHYIPQFILKKFIDKDGKNVQYWNIKKQVLEKRNTKSVFMNIDMYRDEINHGDNPTSIENTLSIFEGEIADLINKKFIDENEIKITRKELEKLRIFLSLLSFRSDYRMNQYKDKKFTESTKSILVNYSEGNDFMDLWKREIEELAKIRNYDELDKNTTIDPIIKTDFEMDLKGFFMTVIDARGGEFLISDIYPTLEVFPLINGVNIHLHCLFPISPNRMLLLNHIMFKSDKSKIDSDSVIKQMVELSKIKGNMIVQPKVKYVLEGTVNPNDVFTYKPKKIYGSDVEYLNALALNEAKNGIVFSNSSKIMNSIIHYDERNDIKNNYNELEKKIKEQGGQ